MQLEEFLERSARRSPGKTALVCAERRATYRQLEQQSNQIAHGLLAEGIRSGDRVAVYLDNSLEAVVAIFAILKAGAVFMMVNPTTKVDKLAYMLNDSGARGLIMQGQKLATLHDAWARIPQLQLVVAVGSPPRTAPECPRRMAYWTELLAQHTAATDPPPKRCIDIDLAALIYTSGSTGNPKGVMMTHLSMVAAATSITTYLRNVPKDIILNVLPLSFDYGLYQALMAARMGATLVLDRGFTFPAAALQKVVQERVTGLPIVPTILAILLRMDLEQYDLSHLRYISNTGAALPIEHIRRLRRLLPHVAIYSMYGLTECKRVAYLPPDQIDARPGSVGRAMPNTQTYIVDDQGHPVGPGVVGELVVRGANVMKGYWNLPDETDHVLKPGPLPGEKVLYTGDLFTTDADGYLYFVGRQDDIIKSRGEKVSPREVENVLYNLDGVTEAAVIGIDDPILGQAIKAIIAPRNGAQLTEKQIQGHCARHLEDFMVPKFVEFRDTLPKNPAGKIDKLQLAQPPLPPRNETTAVSAVPAPRH